MSGSGRFPWSMLPASSSGSSRISTCSRRSAEPAHDLRVVPSWTSLWWRCTRRGRHDDCVSRKGEIAMETTTESFAATSQARAIRLPDVPADEARAHLRRALAKEGFAIVEDVDLADLLGRRLDEAIEPYFIVEGCHPVVAKQALAIAWDCGLVVPA